MSIVGAIPSSIFNESINKDGYTATYPVNIGMPFIQNKYISKIYLSLLWYYGFFSDSHNDTRVIINIAFTVETDNYVGMEVNGIVDYSLLGWFHSKLTVKNICSCQRYFIWSHFFTLNWNKKINILEQNLLLKGRITTKVTIIFIVCTIMKLLYQWSNHMMGWCYYCDNNYKRFLSSIWRTVLIVLKIESVIHLQENSITRLLVTSLLWTRFYKCLGIYWRNMNKKLLHNWC